MNMSHFCTLGSLSEVEESGRPRRLGNQTDTDTETIAQKYLSVCLFKICMPMCDFRVTVPFLMKVKDLSYQSLGPFTSFSWRRIIVPSASYSSAGVGCR